MNTVSVFIDYDWHDLVTRTLKIYCSQRIVTGSNAYYGFKYSMYYPSVYFEFYATESRVYQNASIKYVFILFNFSSLFPFDWDFSSFSVKALGFKLISMIFQFVVFVLLWFRCDKTKIGIVNCNVDAGAHRRMRGGR